ncbi:MAG: vitamin K epoxide reductase family protein [Conexivisphaerales archaeon]
MRNLSKSFVIISVIGIAIAIYDAYEYITEDFRYCSINSRFSCGAVFASGHTSIFGIPFYILGLIWFPLVLLSGLASIKSRGEASGQYLLLLLIVGDIFTIYLWYLELVVIGAICPVCLSLYIVNYILTAVVLASFFV